MKTTNHIARSVGGAKRRDQKPRFDLIPLVFRESVAQVLGLSPSTLTVRPACEAFDLERVFLTGKYALSFLDPSGEEHQNQAKVRGYWQKRLKAL